jgi:hypothetical protein
MIKPDFLLCPQEYTNYKTSDLQSFESIKMTVLQEHTKETVNKTKMTETEAKLHFVS